MAGLGATTLDLGRLRGRLREMLSAAKANAPAGRSPVGSGRLTEVEGFGSNPGLLRMLTYAPQDLPRSPAMVVVLHGCTQTAAGYDLGAGWSALAERYGFVVLCPEQGRENNPQSCFNWFSPADIGRDQGEALSIRQMIERAARDHKVDRSRIFVTGLSAGGAMAAVLLATYPEVFAAGGIVAGLPYGCAANLQEAMKAMFDRGTRPAPVLGDLVRGASSHGGPWPRVSIWHGDADPVVTPGNATELVKQWTDVHGLRLAAAEREDMDGFARNVWVDCAGREAVEFFSIHGMGHGTPLRIAAGEESWGEAGPFLLDVGIASSLEMLRFWGLAEKRTGAVVHPQPEQVAALRGSAEPVAPAGIIEMPRRPRGRTEAPREPDEILPPERGPDGGPASAAAPENPIAKVINDALRAAGLLKA